MLGYRLSATGAAGLFGLGKLFVSAHVGPSPRVAVVLLSVVVSALARTRRSSSTSSGGGVALGPRMYLLFPVPPRRGIEKWFYGGEPFDEKLGDRAGDIRTTRSRSALRIASQASFSVE